MTKKRDATRGSIYAWRKQHSKVARGCVDTAEKTSQRRHGIRIEKVGIFKDQIGLGLSFLEKKRCRFGLNFV